MYASFVPLDKRSAQELQVNEMCLAFSNLASLTRIGIKRLNSENFGYEVFETLWFDSIVLRKINLVYQFLKLLSDPWDIVYTRNKLFAVFSLLLGKRTVLELHDAERSFFKKVILWCISLHSSSLIVTISHGLLADVNRYTYRNSKKCVLHDAVRSEDLNCPKSSYSIEEKAMPLIMYTGSLHKGKDINQIEFLLNTDLDFILHVVGGSVEEVGKLRLKYKDDRLLLTPRVPKEKLVELRKNVDLFFYPLSFSNTLYKYTSPLKLFEYMSSGVPILGSNIGSVSEIIDDSTAFCFHPNCPLFH